MCSLETSLRSSYWGDLQPLRLSTKRAPPSCSIYLPCSGAPVPACERWKEKQYILSVDFTPFLYRDSKNVFKRTLSHETLNQLSRLRRFGVWPWPYNCKIQARRTVQCKSLSTVVHCILTDFFGDDDDEVMLNVLRCQLTYYGQVVDQCRSIVQYIFTSTETRRLVRAGSPGGPPRLSCDHCSGIGPYFCNFAWASHSSGAVWDSRWPSWAVRPSREPSGFCGRKAILNHTSALLTLTACP